MLISVVTPNYNGAAFIRRTIESVLAQRGVELDYVVVDDGSQDDSREIIRSYGDRIRLVAKPNGGLSSAINAGFREARGPVVCWIDSDNLLLPGALARAREVFERAPETAIAYGDYYRIDADDRIVGLRRQPSYDRRIALYGYQTISNAAVFLNRSVLEAVGYADEQFRTACDFDLFVRMARHGPVVHIPEYLGTYRLHAGALHVALKTVEGEEQWAIRSRESGGARSLRTLRLLHRYYQARVLARMVREGAIWSRVWPFRTWLTPPHLPAA